MECLSIPNPGHYYLHECVVCMFICTCICMPVWICVHLTLTSGVFLCHSLLHWGRAPGEPGAHQFWVVGREPSWPRSPCLSPEYRDYMCLPHFFGFHIDVRGPGSNSFTCWATHTSERERELKIIPVAPEVQTGILLDKMGCWNVQVKDITLEKFLDFPGSHGD